MAAEQQDGVRLEIGHVLFIDIVGYSKLLITQQSELLHKLKEIVRGTEQFGIAEAEGRLLRLPTGDGAALVFRNNPEAPVLCAMEISRELKKHPELRVRMGIHSGPVSEICDLNDQANITGAGINIAQRVMDCGDAGHILVSKRVAEDLEQYDRWQASLHDLGECEVKHGARVHLFNLYTDDIGNPSIPQKLGEGQAGERVRNNLPAELSSFIGRTAELAQIKQLLASTRLLALTGAGGCGKTRLAMQAAADLLAQYPDGVWLVELAPASQAEMVVQFAAEVLGVSEEVKRPLIETIAERVQSKRLLLLLDNCEHLLAAAANFTAALLKSSSRVTILATSREPFAIAGEQVFQVPPLETPASGAAMLAAELLSQCDAVRLFCERAAAVQPRFALSDATAPAVAQICQRVNGIPLALELAAARTSALSPVQIAERLRDSFDLLSRGRRTGLPHHQTLRATIDWSYALLGEAERRFFAAVSVFVGGFDLEAAENVCFGEGIEQGEILDLLTQLVEKSLIVARDQDGTARYHLLEPIRQYAQRCLRDSGTISEVQQRYAHYFLHFAEEAQPRLLGPEQLITSERLEAEHVNLLAALSWAVEHNPETALKLANALGWFWEFRGYLAQGRDWFEKTAAPALVQCEDLRGEALVRAGRLACWQGEFEDAVELTKEGIGLCERSGNRRWLGLALNNLGGIAAYRGQLDEAEIWLDRSLPFGKDDPDLVWRTSGDRSMVAMARGEYERARNLQEQAMERLRQVGISERTPHEAYRMLQQGQGEIELALGNTDQAAIHYERALAITRSFGNKRAMVGALDGLGKVAFDRGDYTGAHRCYEEALKVAEELGHKSDYAIVLRLDLAELAIEEQRFEEAERLANSSLRDAQEVGDNESLVAALSTSAWLRFVFTSQPEVAAQLYGALDHIREALGRNLPPREHNRHEHRIAAIRSALAEKVFTNAWIRGKAMRLDEAVVLAFGK